MKAIFVSDSCFSNCFAFFWRSMQKDDRRSLPFIMSMILRRKKLFFKQGSVWRRGMKCRSYAYSLCILLIKKVISRVFLAGRHSKLVKFNEIRTHNAMNGIIEMYTVHTTTEGSMNLKFWLS